MLQVLPMSLRPGDRLADEAGEWEVPARTTGERFGSTTTAFRFGTSREPLV